MSHETNTKPNTSFTKRFLHRAGLIELPEASDKDFTRKESVVMAAGAVVLAVSGLVGLNHRFNDIESQRSGDQSGHAVPGNVDDHKIGE